MTFPVVSDYRLLSLQPFGLLFDKLHNLTGGESRGPGPLKVITTQLARHVHHFADKVEPGNTPGFPGLGRELPVRDASDCHFSFSKTFRSGRRKLEPVNVIRNFLKLPAAVLLQRPRRSVKIAPGLRKPSRQVT